MSKWEDVPNTSIAMDRFPVPGGWIYRAVDWITFVPEPCPAPTHDQVVVGAKALSDLIEATTDLLQSVKRRVPNIILAHECDVAYIALNNLSEYMLPEGKTRDRSNELSEASIG